MTDRLIAVLKTKKLSQKQAAELLQLSQSKMSKVISGEQKLSAASAGILIKEFEIYPNWLFGYEGNDEKVMYMKDLVPKSELEKRDQQIQELRNELGDVYKQLAEERRSK